FARGRLGVVGVDEQDEIFRPRVREVLERLRLVVVDLDIGVRHRAEDRDAEALVGQYGGGGGQGGRGGGRGRPRARPRRPPAPAPCARRNPKSTRRLPGAARTMRAALAAIIDWNCNRLITRVSTSWACGNAAVTRRIGSSAKNTVPSGMACTSPVKRMSAR